MTGQTELWGAETRKAVENFPVSGEPIPASVVHWLGRIKAAAAHVNADLGLLDTAVADRIASAADEVGEGRHDAQFPIDVFQTGSGTSSNMNANEVIATPRGRGRPPERPREHGPVVERRLPVRRPPGRARLRDEPSSCRRSTACAAALAAKADEFADIVKTGRTHLMDAVPVTLGQEFGGYAAQVREGTRPGRVARCRASARSRSAAPPSAPGLNTHPEFAARVARAAGRAHRACTISPPRRPLRGAGRPRRAGRGVRRAQDRRRLADQDRQRHPLDGIGPARRPGRDLPARAPEGLARSCPAR